MRSLVRTGSTLTRTVHTLTHQRLTPTPSLARALTLPIAPVPHRDGLVLAALLCRVHAHQVGEGARLAQVAQLCGTPAAQRG